MSLRKIVEVAILNQEAAFRRAAIDREFGSMAADSAYLREAVQIADEFSTADWEALQTGESGLYAMR